MTFEGERLILRGDLYFVCCEALLMAFSLIALAAILVGDDANTAIRLALLS